MTKKQKQALAARLALVQWHGANGAVCLGDMDSDYRINCHRRCLNAERTDIKYGGYTQHQWAKLFWLSLTMPEAWLNSDAEWLKETLDGAQESEAKQRFIAQRLAEAHEEWDRLQLGITEPTRRRRSAPVESVETFSHRQVLGAAFTR